MLSRPALNPRYRFEVIEGQGVVLLSRDDSAILLGQLAQRLVDIIDGQLTTPEIITYLQEVTSAGEVYKALEQMEQAEYLLEGEGLDDISAKEFIAIGTSPDYHTAPTSRTLKAKVTVKTFGDLDTQIATSVLEAQAIEVNDQADRLLLLAENYQSDHLLRACKEAWDHGQSVLLVNPAGRTLWVGPIIEPGQTGCLTCLQERLQANTPLRSFVERLKNSPAPPPSTVEVHLSSLAYAMAGTAITQWCQGHHTCLANRIIAFDSETLATQEHVFAPLPDCPTCGSTSTTQPSALVLQPVLKPTGKSMAHSTTPQATFEKYSHHISPITGIVRRLIPLSPHPLIHTYLADHDMGWKASTLSALPVFATPPSAGKGTTDEQARTSALCEALEHYACVYRGNEPSITSSQEVLGMTAYCPNACMLFSERQYRERRSVESSMPYARQVPEPFDSTAPIAWAPLWSLTHGRMCYLPMGYCYFNYPRDKDPYSIADSNGNAAGNTLEEAILSGFLELVERDAAALWWYNRTLRPAIDLSSFKDPYIDDLCAYYQSIGRDLWVLDVTTDLDIPAAVAVSANREHEPQQIRIGFGCHLSMHCAVRKALCELNQMLPSLLDERRKPLQSDIISTRHWLRRAHLQDHPYLLPAASCPRHARSFPDHATLDFRDDVHFCIRQAETHGLETLVLELTRRDVGLPTVKVVVPGMRHFWRRLAPGRLYEVPLRERWCAKPSTEDTLNPQPLIL